MSFLRFQVAAGAGASAFADKGAAANRFARLFDPTLALHYKFATTQSLKDLRGGPTMGVVRAGTAQNNGHMREMRVYTVKKSAEFVKNLSAGLIPA